MITTINLMCGVSAAAITAGLGGTGWVTVSYENLYAVIGYGVPDNGVNVSEQSFFAVIGRGIRVSEIAVSEQSVYAVVEP